MMVRSFVGAALLVLGGTMTALGADGAAVYGANCAKCHGSTGQADTPVAKAMKVPPLAGDAKVTEASQADVVKRIKENPKHAAFIGKLTAEDLDAVAAHVKGLAAKK
jgi:mono/diheme cytochrome c family protein